jgi:plastocyanin/peptidoglycan hydrolase-like protein with peptidoglycan-binding domain
MSYTLRVSSLAAALSLVVLALLLPHKALAANITVTMTDNQFTPQNVTVYAGDTVTFVNHGSMPHTATADNGSFDTGSIAPASGSSAVFNTLGTFAYHCQFHGGAGGIGMSGTITVLPAGANYVNPNMQYSQPVQPAPVYTSSNPQTAQLYAQVQSLLAQISALQAQGGVSTGGSSANVGSIPYNTSQCPQIGRSLKIGASGDDVSRLQQFLARDSAVYPEGKVTGYYGALTQAAVQRWQAKYNVVSSGSPDTTGYGVVGPRTAAAISLLCSTGSVNGVAGPTGGNTNGGNGQAAGVIQATPIAGNAPLTVTVVATVNIGGACGGALYTLSFGDGTPPQQISVAGGNCSPQQQTYQHQYVYGGTYQITLTSGSHTTSVQVAVTGPAGPNSGVINGTNDPTQPRGTISTVTTSGRAPFNATFYVSCASGVNYNVSFGDGTDLGSNAVGNTKCGTGSLDAVTHTYTTSGNYNIQLIIFIQQQNGTVVPVTIQSVGISISSVADNYSYNPPQLSPGSSALNFSVQFDLPTACTGYDVSWGDGTADAVQSDGGSACAQTTTIKTASHTYAQNGSYTITVKRGASLSHSDTIAVTVQ